MGATESTSPAGDQRPRRSFWSEATIPIAVAIITVGGGAFATYINARDQAQELNLKYIQLGIGILRAKPDDKNTAKIRGWAIKVVDRYAPVKFTKAEREQLMNRAIKAHDLGYGYTDDFGSSYYSNYGTIPKLSRPNRARSSSHSTPPKEAR